jgi:hypothetical protein
MPALRTKMIPAKAARSGTRGATFGLGRLLGQEGFDGVPEVIRDQGFVLHAPKDATAVGF